MHSDDFQTVGYYRFMSDMTVSISRSRPCLMKVIRSESSESDDFQTVGYYRLMSDATVSISRTRQCLTKEIRSETSESDDFRPSDTIDSYRVRQFLLVVSDVF